MVRTFKGLFSSLRFVDRRLLPRRRADGVRIRSRGAGPATASRMPSMACEVGSQDCDVLSTSGPGDPVHPVEDGDLPAYEYLSSASLPVLASLNAVRENWVVLFALVQVPKLDICVDEDRFQDFQDWADGNVGVTPESFDYAFRPTLREAIETFMDESRYDYMPFLRLELLLRSALRGQNSRSVEVAAVKLWCCLAATLFGPGVCFAVLMDFRVYLDELAVLQSTLWKMDTVKQCADYRSAKLVCDGKWLDVVLQVEDWSELFFGDKRGSFASSWCDEGFFDWHRNDGM